MDRCKELGESIPEQLRRQLEFILEIDRLKSVLRQSYLIDSDRHENSAEHSWHLAVAAMVLAEHAKERIDVSKVIRLVLVHDMVEIDAATRSSMTRPPMSGKQPANKRQPTGFLVC